MTKQITGFHSTYELPISGFALNSSKGISIFLITGSDDRVSPKHRSHPTHENQTQEDGLNGI